MDEQGTNIEELQHKGMDTPDHYIDLSKYDTISDINGEIEKLQQDIEIRRRVRKRMGIDDDDENILIIDEKIKLLDTERKKRETKEQESARKAILIVLFIGIVIPITMLNPTVGAGLIVVIIIVRILVRKRRRKKKDTVNIEKPEVEKQIPNQ